MSESPTWITTIKISGKVKRGLPFSRGVFSHDGKGDSKWSFTESEILTCSEGLPSLDTQGQIVGARESLNGRENMARRKVKNSEKSPWGQCLTRPVPNGRSGFWLVPENSCAFLPNQKPERGSPRMRVYGRFAKVVFGNFWSRVAYVLGQFPTGVGGGGWGLGYSWEFLVGVGCPVPQILIQFQTKKCNFPHPFSD